MFEQSVELIRAHQAWNGNGGKTKAEKSIYEQESNYIIWRLAKMQAKAARPDAAISTNLGELGHGR